MGLDVDDEQALTRIRRICSGLAGAEEARLQERPLFHVARRRFALFNGVGSPPRLRWAGWGRSLHLLVEPEEREALRANPRCAPSPHHGDRGWVGLGLDGATDWVELAELLDAAHRQVVPRGPGRR